MASILDPVKSLRVPGRLCRNPTDLSIAFPHGGEDLGLVTNMAFRPNQRRYEATGEEYGGETVETYVTGERILFVAALLGAPESGCIRIFRDATAARIRYPGSSLPGSLGSAQSFKLLFSPRDKTVHPGLMIYKAIPMLDEAAEIAISLNTDFIIPVMFRGIRDGTGRVYEIAKLADMAI